MGIVLQEYNRPLVEDVEFVFERNPATQEMLTNAQKYLPYMPQSLGKSYNNLTRLKLVGWDVKNTFYVKLWAGLNADAMEEIWLEDCRTLSNVCFIGEMEELPEFTRLTGK